MASPHPCFPMVVGCGRSGTTLLRAMLDSHPALVIPPESRFIPDLLAHEDELITGGAVDPDRFVARLQPNVHFQHWGLDADALRDALVDRAPVEVTDAVRVMFELRAEEAGKPRYGDKSPPYVMKIPELAKAFPEARFVHLVRDGRDVALAYMDAGFGPSAPTEMAVHWKLRVERGARYGQQVGPDRYLEVRYEQLVDDPEKVLTEICRFIDLDFDPAMLDYPERAAELVRSDRQPWNHGNLVKAPTVGLRDWRSQMRSPDVARFELLAGDTLQQFDYPRSTISPRWTDRIVAWTAAARWQLRRVRKRVRG